MNCQRLHSTLGYYVRNNLRINASGTLAKPQPENVRREGALHRVKSLCAFWHRPLVHRNVTKKRLEAAYMVGLAWQVT